MLKLLVVDDETIIRETICRTIDWTSLNIELIGSAASGLEAYDIIMDDSPDIVLTDIKMPGLSGLELLEKIRQVNEDIQFIILSGYGEFSYARQAMHWGVKQYLLKPCNEKEIINAVQAVKKDIERQRLEAPAKADLTRAFNHNIVLNVVNAAIDMRLESDGDFSSRLQNLSQPYEKFIDFTNTPYDLCILDLISERDLPSSFRRLNAFHEQRASSLPSYFFFIDQKLIFFFPHYSADNSLLIQLLRTLVDNPHTPSIESTAIFRSFNSLNALIEQTLSTIKRYEYLYYNDGDSLKPIYNYRRITHSLEQILDRVTDAELTDYHRDLEQLIQLLKHITDIILLKQMLSHVIMTLGSRYISLSVPDAQAQISLINRLESTEEILSSVLPSIRKAIEELHAEKSHNLSLSNTVKAYVAEHYADADLSLKKIAETYLFMNVDYVSKRFARESNVRFSKYLAELRIEKAKELLKQKGLDKIQSIAEMVGCGNNPQYFSQLFKKYTGMTPSIYIKTHTEEQPTQ